MQARARSCPATFLEEDIRFASWTTSKNLTRMQGGRFGSPNKDSNMLVSGCFFGPGVGSKKECLKD